MRTFVDRVPCPGVDQCQRFWVVGNRCRTDLARPAVGMDANSWVQLLDLGCDCFEGFVVIALTDNDIYRNE